MSLISNKGKYGSIDADDSTCHDEYIIEFTSSTFILQVVLSIDVQVISSRKIVCEGTSFY